jgi:hypothetical protein
MVDLAFPWGRHVEHDPASRSFALADHPEVPTGDVVWRRWSPILSQRIGSCTGNAMAGLLACEPFSSRALVEASTRFDEAFAESLYSDATRLDNVPGSWPPNDTGSTGLAVCKAARRRHLITSYGWAFSTRGLLHALQHGPVLLGMAWHEAMNDPDEYGVVRPAGRVLGGHEVLCRGVRAGNLVCDNSWGPTWGPIGGSFLIPVAAWDVLLHEQADVAVPRLVHVD